MPVTPAARLARPRRWPGVVAWTLWTLAMVACLMIPWLDQQLVLAVTLAPGPVDPSVQVLGSPFGFGSLSGVLLVVNQLALAFTTLAVAVCAGSLVARFRRARGVEASSCAGWPWRRRCWWRRGPRWSA